MHIMTQTPKRPRDPNQLAKLIADIATGEIDDAPETAKQAAGRKGGAIGGAVRAASLTPEQRREAAQKAAVARWSRNRT
jgi:hypothetical protein